MKTKEKTLRLHKVYRKTKMYNKGSGSKLR